MSRQAVLIANPASGTASGGGLERAREVISSHDIDLDILHTTAPGDATRLAAYAVEQSPDLIFAAGGDGTINEVINGMAGSQTPLAILPLGTANVLAQELGLPLEPASAAKEALSRSPRRITLGLVRKADESRYFVLMAGIGFDAQAVYNLNTSLKKRTGKLAYVVSGFKTLFSWSPHPLLIRADGRDYRGASVIISNTRKYGGGFVVAPDADITSPDLRVILLEGMGRMDVLRLSLGIVAGGRHTSLKGVRYFTAKRIVIESSAPLQLDGDRAGHSPLEVSAMPDSLSIVF